MGTRSAFAAGPVEQGALETAEMVGMAAAYNQAPLEHLEYWGIADPAQQ
ncbi:MAG: hypothetical protein AB1659_02105 [Thermodesulfobacteriota bacterium]